MNKKGLLLIFLFGVIASCSSVEHRREVLQREHPDCEVDEELNIKCPLPFQREFHY
jgi:hypothetical protein